jgi:chromosome segregation ATPase
MDRQKLAEQAALVATLRAEIEALKAQIEERDRQIALQQSEIEELRKAGTFVEGREAAANLAEGVVYGDALSYEIRKLVRA